MTDPQAKSPVLEKHVSYSLVVPDLAAAWLFVMDHVEEFRSPSIHITPMWSYPGEHLSYEAVVAGVM